MFRPAQGGACEDLNEYIVHLKLRLTFSAQVRLELVSE
jgi:hypothetical protein